MKLLMKKKRSLRLTENTFCLALLLNVLYIVVMLLMYKPFLSPDDYFMSERVYGVFGDEYDYHTSYMSFNYGKFIALLLRIFPCVPWYTILFYIWIFLSLMLVSKLVLDKLPNSISFLVVNIILLYFSYEGYVCIQFTKVAGIVGAAGVLAVILGTTWVEIVVGMGLFILAIFIRIDMARMVVASFLVMILVMLFLGLVSHGKLKWHIKIYVRFSIIMISFFMIPRIPSYDAAQKQYWDFYWQCNSNRSFIQDYELPDYETYKEIYDVLDISENDIYIWKSWNEDVNAMTLDRVNALKKVKNGEITSPDQLEKSEYFDGDVRDYYKNFVNTVDEKEKTNDELDLKTRLIDKLLSYIELNKIFHFFKKFPKVFLSIDVCLGYILVSVLILVAGRKDFFNTAISVLITFGIALLLNYYMYVNGRYLQHRVDVGVFFTMICMEIILCKNLHEIGKEYKYNIMIAVIIIVVMMITPYKNWGDDRCAYDEDYFNCKQKMIDYISQDQAKCYFLAAKRDIGVLWHEFYDAFSVPEVGCMKNCFIGYGFGSLERYQNFGIDYIFSDIVDKDVYLVLDENDLNELAWQEYISKHSNKEVYLDLEKTIYGAKFYTITSANNRDETELK